MHSYDNTVIRSGNDCQMRDLFVALIKSQIAVVLVLVFKSDYTTKRANGIFQWASVVTCKNQTSSYQGKFGSRETKISSSKRGIGVIGVRVNRVK